MTSNRPRRYNGFSRRARIEEPDKGSPDSSDLSYAVDFSRETFDDDRTLVAVWPRLPGPAGPAPPRHRRSGDAPPGLGGL
jgi:hypothetical protein